LTSKKKGSKTDDSNEIKKFIIECENGKIVLKDTLAVNIINLGENVNSEFRDYGPVVVSDGSKIYFTSRRKGTGGNIFADDAQYFEDIYETQKTGNSWTKARNAGTPLNTKEHDAVVGISPDGQQLFTYKDVNGGDIYVSKLRGSRWGNPESVSAKINTKYHETKASLSFDGKTLYFISNRSDLSLGGHDIFFSELDANGDWSTPQNIGNTINTPYDEADIFVHPDGRTLYFSSKGHNSIGGYDIFKTVKDASGKWSTPMNLGYPINTPDDDIFFVITASGKIAYFSSFREGGYGNHDLYEIQFLDTRKKTDDNDKPNADKVLVTLVKGTVIDAKTELPLEANIDIVDLETNNTVAQFITNSQTGKYIINLPSGKNYGINVNKETYLFHSENFDLPDTTDYQELIVDIKLNRFETGTTITLKNVFFDYDKSTIRPESETELNNVINIMQKNVKIKVEISGHTDSKGSDEYNKNLSNERAKAVVEYLTKHGIAQSRLTYHGYGKEKPVATNDTDEGRQQNRRIEFTIIEK
jgi:outer membrane protein OmpA-like peptidoglycan-associated protein